MGTYENTMAWLDKYKDRALDILRIYLGIGLFVRGLLFLLFPSTYTQLLPADAALWMTSPFVVVGVALIHLIGGALLAVGMWTRLAALVQIPILFGAVFLVSYQGGLFTANQSFEFSTLVLFLLALLAVYGSQHWALSDRLDVGVKAFEPLTRWGNAHRDIAFDLLRIYLGVGLFVRGAVFIADANVYMALVPPASSEWITSLVLLHTVALLHLTGGALMAVGLLTRIAALIQLPVLLGAVFIAQLKGGLLTPSQSLEFTVLVFFLLVLIFLYGSGKRSMDYLFFERMQTAETEARSVRADEILRQAELTAPPPIPEPELGEGGVGVLERPAVAVQTGVGTKTCTCGHDRHHPLVEADVHYGLGGALHFLLGITGPPKEVVFRCRKCNNIVEVSHDPKDLEYYRYRT